MTLLIGTSGWQYRDWRGSVYPDGLASARWLAHYSSLFSSVENNGTFYRLAAPETFARWREEVPDGFVMAVKASRYLTHVRRLGDPAGPVSRLLSAAAGLGDALGPVLLQLPPTMRADAALLDGCLAQFTAEGRRLPGGRVRVCVEVRHPSWETDQIRQILTSHNAALCWSDRRGRPQGPLWRTADWGYVRLHEGTAQPRPRYGRQALASWLDRVSEAWPDSSDVYVYFNNDAGAAAPADAAALAAAADRRGLPVARPRQCGPGT